MAKDYAKTRQSNRKTSTKRRKSPKKSTSVRRSTAKTTQGGWRLFFAGLICGVFGSFLVYLSTLPEEAAPRPVPTASSEPTPPAKTDEQPKPRFDFYTMLPEQTLEVETRPSDVDPAGDVGSPAVTFNKYLLQAGSFRVREDADRRRAELLLLGLEPNIEEAQGDNGRWFRVYLGPYESRSAMSHARSLTAQQGIDTLLLKRNSP